MKKRKKKKEEEEKTLLSHPSCISVILINNSLSFFLCIPLSLSLSLSLSLLITYCLFTSFFHLKYNPPIFFVFPIFILSFPFFSLF
ncbi:hypothetical protein IC575_015823 [Cucumis melo]